jgi:hypothetical protein
VDKSKTNPDVGKLITFGQMALEQGWYEQAREYFEQALALDAGNREAMKGLARVNEILSRRAAKAVEPIEAEIREEPLSAERISSRLSSAREWIDKQREERAERAAERERLAAEMEAKREKLAAEEREEQAMKDRIEKQAAGFEFQVKGHNGQIELYGNKVCIRRKGVLAFLTQGLKGDKEIMISSISSIQFKKASAWTNGYIQFSFIGGQEAKGGIRQATKDENTVMFTAEQQPDFERIKAEIENRIQAKSIPSAPSSDADEIAKLADLRDKGILTEEEFQQKKKQILGL